MGKVLIIDDHLATCAMLKQMVERIHHQAEYCNNLAEGMQKIEAGGIDVVFLDVNMPDGNGLVALKQIRLQTAPPEVIIITGIGDSNGAEIAIRNGAWDYLQKPLSPKEILLPVKRVLEYKQHAESAKKTPRILKREEIIGNSALLNQCLEQLARAAENQSNVLITGETGTGKDVFARTLHANSQRREKRLVTVDCASLPESLIADSLFGHVKGAFTGADRTTAGLVKLADGGSLFLDEIGELDLALQKTLLRVIQEKKFLPVGSSAEVQSDFRLIAATNRDLGKMVAKGLFREDLYFRIHAQLISLPPLRRRLEDLEVLLIHSMKRFSKKYGKPAKGFSSDFLETLLGYHWPGNVREFSYVIEEAMYVSGNEPILFPKHLPENIRIQVIRKALVPARPKPVQAPAGTSQPAAKAPAALPPLREVRENALADAEKTYLLRLMDLTRGNIKDACRVAGIGRTHLYNLLKKHCVLRSNFA